MRPLSRAAILAVGSEMLTPLRIDTNSLFITEQLNALGVEVVFKTVVGDDRAELAHSLRGALDRVDLVVCSGGLGPTDDDLTREVAADVLGRPLREDEGITSHIRTRFTRRGMQMPEINRRQAMVPEGGVVIDNPNGSAPGLWLERDDRVVLLLPGPPRELKPMLTRLVDGSLAERAAGLALVRRVVRITGRTESHTEEALQPLYAPWALAPLPVAATILASLGQIELHLSVRAESRAAAAAALDRAVQQVVERLGPDVYSTDGRALEQVVGELLAERGLRIAVAESCTGGLITSRLTDVPGSSRYVDQSVISYSNEAKTSLLGVPPDLIAAHGAVSEAAAMAMADGMRTRAGVEVAVAVTGIAGPGGGSAAKPVGTVCFAWARKGQEMRSETRRFRGGRTSVRRQSVIRALEGVLQALDGG
jgi:nicotinamide-nucleotide amidase